jgi:carbon storage regulator
MLVFTRYVGEAVVIGHETVLTVLGIEQNRVKLGFDAPKTVAVNRMEVEERPCQDHP